jgi:predicted nucleic acid-binding OB-fold protein
VYSFEWTADKDRRRAPRVDLLMELKGSIIALNAAATVLQLSTRGMTVESTTPLSPSTSHDFRLNLGHRTLDLRTRVVHSRMVVERDDVSYLSGLAFVDLTPDAANTLDTLVRSLVEDEEAGVADQRPAGPPPQ